MKVQMHRFRLGTWVVAMHTDMGQRHEVGLDKMLTVEGQGAQGGSPHKELREWTLIQSFGKSARLLR